MGAGVWGLKIIKTGVCSALFPMEEEKQKRKMNLKQKKMEEINRNKTQNWALERETRFPSPLASISFRSAVRNGGFSPPPFF